MDFSRFDQRGNDEAGRKFPILHPHTGEPFPGAFFIIRGNASPTVSSAHRALRQSAMWKEATETDDIEVAYKAAVAFALPHIVGFEGVERDGVPCTADDAEWFLNRTYPVFGATISNQGDTFPTQVRRRAEEVSLSLGNALAP